MTRILPTPVLVLLLLLITTAIYWPGLSGDFIFDDYPNIVTNPKVHAASLDQETLKRAATAYEPGTIGRPLATISFSINYYFGEKSPWGYKLTGLIIHVLNAVLVFFLVMRLLQLPKVIDRTLPLLSAFAISLLWAIHPLQVSSVLYVVQRMEILSLTFVLLGLILYLRGRSAQISGNRGWHWLVASALLAGTGLLSKETAILFPAYTLALELTVLRFDAQSSKTKRYLKLVYAASFAIAGLLFLAVVVPQYATIYAYQGRDFTLYERLLTQPRVLSMYIGQILMPIPESLIFYYDSYSKSTSWLQPITTLSGGFLVILLLAGAWAFRSRAPLAALGIFWFFAAHLLTSNVFNLELVFEHRNYFAILGILLVFSDLLIRIPFRNKSALKPLLVGTVIIAFGFLSILRSATWGDPLHLASDLVANNPQSARASSDLATLYLGMADGNPDSPFFEFSRKEFERGSRLQNASPLPEQGLILMSATTNQPVKDEWWIRLIHKVRTQPISPQQTMAVTGLLKQRFRGIPLDDSRLSEAYLALLSRGPQAPYMYAQFGDYALNYLHDEKLADEMFVAAIELDPGNKVYAERIVSSLLKDGHTRQAELVVKRLEELSPQPID